MNLFDAIVSGAKMAGSSVGDYLYDSASEGIDNFGHGLEQLWYNLTGQKHLTDTYKHEEQLELNKNQLTAQDMEKAGLSKYAMVGSSVGSLGASTGSHGIDLLNGIIAMQSIKRNALEFKEQKYNFEMSKRLGIRTDDTNQLAKIAPYVKALTGYDINDIPEGGLIGSFLDSLGFTRNNYASDESGSVSSVTSNPVVTLDVPSLHPVNEDRHYAVFRNNLAKATKNFTGPIDGDYLRYFMKVTVDDLMKYKGYSFDRAASDVNRWTTTLLHDYPDIELYQFILSNPKPYSAGFGVGGGGGSAW